RTFALVLERSIRLAPPVGRTRDRGRRLDRSLHGKRSLDLASSRRTDHRSRYGQRLARSHAGAQGAGSRGAASQFTAGGRVRPVANLGAVKRTVEYRFFRKGDVMNSIERPKRAPVPRATDTTLSRDYYVSQQIFEREFEKVFFKQWTFAGHVSQIPNV